MISTIEKEVIAEIINDLGLTANSVNALNDPFDLEEWRHTGFEHVQANIMLARAKLDHIINGTELPEWVASRWASPFTPHPSPAETPSPQGEDN